MPVIMNGFAFRNGELKFNSSTCGTEFLRSNFKYASRTMQPLERQYIVSIQNVFFKKCKWIKSLNSTFCWKKKHGKLKILELYQLQK